MSKTVFLAGTRMPVEVNACYSSFNMSFMNYLIDLSTPPDTVVLMRDGVEVGRIINLFVEEPNNEVGSTRAGSATAGDPEPETQ